MAKCLTSAEIRAVQGHIGQSALRKAVESISTPAPSAAAANAEIPQGSFDNLFDLNSDVKGDVSKV